MIVVQTQYVTQTDQGSGGATELTQLTDVNITSPTDGQVLTYDSTTSKWINEAGAPDTITLTGDVTGTGSGTIDTTIAASGVTADTYGDGTHVAQFTVGTDGRITDASSVSISFPVTSVNSYTGAVTLTKSDVGLSNVENTALSTWAGTTNITTLGTISSGTWSGTAVALNKGGTGATTQAGAANAVLPSQTSNSGKYLTTDGSNVSWATVSGGVSWAAFGGTPATITNNSTNGVLAITYGSSASSTIQSSGTTSRVLAIGNGISTAGTTSDSIFVWNTGSTTSRTLSVTDVYDSIMISCNTSTAMTLTSSNYNFVHISPSINNSTPPGYGSVAVGAFSRATGGYDIALGRSALCTGGFGVAIGNTSSATNGYSTAVGNSCVASGSNGGSVAIGNSSVASGNSAIAIGTGYAQAQQDYCITIGSDGCVTNKAYNIIIACRNIDSDNDNTGDAIFGAGSLLGSAAITNTSSSKSPRIKHNLMGRQTTDATPVDLYISGTSSSIAYYKMSNQSVIDARVRVIGTKQYDTTNCAVYDFEFAIGRSTNAASTRILGTVTKTVVHEDTTGWDCDITADTTNGGFKITVTGAASTTVDWLALLDLGYYCCS